MSLKLVVDNTKKSLRELALELTRAKSRSKSYFLVPTHREGFEAYFVNVGSATVGTIFRKNPFFSNQFYGGQFSDRPILGKWYACDSGRSWTAEAHTKDEAINRVLERHKQ